MILKYLVSTAFRNTHLNYKYNNRIEASNSRLIIPFDDKSLLDKRTYYYYFHGHYYYFFIIAVRFSSTNCNANKVSIVFPRFK